MRKDELPSTEEKVMREHKLSGGSDESTSYFLVMVRKATLRISHGRLALGCHSVFGSI